MKRTDLHSKMHVAAVDQTGSIERAVVLEVGGWSKKKMTPTEKGLDHLVQFLTGQNRQSTVRVSSRQIVATWEDYEQTWEERRLAELRAFSKEALQDYEWSEAVSDLEVVRAVLSTLEVDAFLTSLTQDGSRRPALVIDVESAKTLLNHLQTVGFINLTSV